MQKEKKRSSLETNYQTRQLRKQIFLPRDGEIKKMQSVSQISIIRTSFFRIVQNNHCPFSVYFFYLTYLIFIFVWGIEVLIRYANKMLEYSSLTVVLMSLKKILVNIYTNNFALRWKTFLPRIICFCTQSKHRL